jgi:hypothetical protein
MAGSHSGSTLSALTRAMTPRRPSRCRKWPPCSPRPRRWSPG